MEQKDRQNHIKIEAHHMGYKSIPLIILALDV